MSSSATSTRWHRSPRRFLASWMALGAMRRRSEWTTRLGTPSLRWWGPFFPLTSFRLLCLFSLQIPRIQHVFSTYCARHNSAIVRLQELEPSLRTYLLECKNLAHGRTKAWDLASLLIRPVQRCLKCRRLFKEGRIDG